LTGFFAKTVAINTHPTLKNTLTTNATFESNFAGERLTYKLGDKGDRITQYFYYALNPSRTGAGLDTTPDVARNIEYVGGYLAKHFNLLGKSCAYVLTVPTNSVIKVPQWTSRHLC